MVQPDQENSGGDSQAAAASQPFIPSETVVPHLNMVCDELQLLGQPEVEAFKSVYIAIGQLERSGYCASNTRSIGRAIVASAASTTALSYIF
ncbi:MAG: hypothetical protein MHMPM18_004114 [Marteilia pararefringens]